MKVVKQELYAPKDERAFRPFLVEVFRFIGYGATVFLLAELMRWDALQTVGEGKFSEYSFVEYAQSIILLISSILAWTIYIKKMPYRYVALLLFGLCSVSFFREQDIYFETHIGQSTWQIPVYLILFWVLATTIRKREQFMKEIQVFVKTKVFGLLSTGLLTVYLFSRLFGRRIFWQAVMEERYFRDVKNAAEECLELYGYLIILLAIIELFTLSNRAKEATTATELTENTHLKLKTYY